MYRIFIVDDEIKEIKHLKSLIDSAINDFEIIGESCNGIDAYDQILLMRPNVVLTEICIRGMNGLELIKKIKEKIPAIQFIVVSAYAEFGYVQKAVNNGAVGYCLKSFDDGEIISMLNKLKAIQNIDHRLPEMQMLNIYRNKNYEVTAQFLKNDSIRKIVEYLNNNFSSDISLESVSKRFYINASYICQLFKKEIGMTFLEYITRLRISHASDLLINTTMTINEISTKTGYRDYYYFTRIFKKMTGKTPSQFRSLRL